MANNQTAALAGRVGLNLRPLLLLLGIAAAVAAGVSTKGIYVVKAENSELWDADGRRYVDFAAGIAVLNTGHRHPRVMAAVAQHLP